MLFLLISILLYCLQNITNKAFSRHFPVRLGGIILLDALAMSIVVLVFGLAGRAGRLEPAQLLYAFIFSAVYALTIITLQGAIASGPLGATILLNNIYMIFPVIFSLIFFQEVATVPKVIGIGCMFAVAILSAPRDSQMESGQKKASLRWFLLTCATTLGNGTLTIMKRSLSWLYPEVSPAAFTFWGFLFFAIICWLLVIIMRLRHFDFSVWTADPKALGLSALGVGVATSGGTLFQLLALQTVPAIVVFPLNAGGLIIILWLYALIVYKDKVRPVNLVALAFGLSGAVLLSI